MSMIQVQNLTFLIQAALTIFLRMSTFKSIRIGNLDLSVETDEVKQHSFSCY